MPGVPPDAMDKIKGALRGMFKSKKKGKTDTAAPSGTKPAATPTAAGTTDTATPTTAAPAAAIPNTTTHEPAGTGEVVEGAWPGPSATGTESTAVGAPSTLETGTPIVAPVAASETAPIAAPASTTAPAPATTTADSALAQPPAPEGGLVEPTPVPAMKAVDTPAPTTTTASETKPAAVTEAVPHHDPVAAAYPHAFEKFPTSLPAAATSTAAPVPAATSTTAPTA